MGKAGVMGGVSAAVSFGIGALQSSITGMAQVAMSAQEAILSGLGQVIGAFLPSWEVHLGDWTFSVGFSLALGKGNSFGVNFGLSYSSGDFELNIGFGISYFGNHPGSETKGFEYRKSIMTKYGSKDFSLSLGTNIWSGLKGVDGEDLGQRTGMIGIKSGDFGLMYENDGGFGIKDLRLGNRGDSYRTAALNLSIGDFSAGFNLFTGRRTREDQKKENTKIGANIRDSNGVFHKNSFVNEQGPKYRLGALAIGYKGIRIGVNSEHIRHAIQNSIIHRLIDDGEFETTSWDWKPYYQYRTSNIFTSW